MIYELGRLEQSLGIQKRVVLAIIKDALLVLHWGCGFGCNGTSQAGCHPIYEDLLGIGRAWEWNVANTPKHGVGPFETTGLEYIGPTRRGQCIDCRKFNVAKCEFACPPACFGRTVRSQGNNHMEMVLGRLGGFVFCFLDAGEAAEELTFERQQRSLRGPVARDWSGPSRALTLS